MVPSGSWRFGLAGQRGESVRGVGLRRLTPALAPGDSEQAVAEAIDRGHELGPHLGVVAHVQVPGTLAVGVAAQETPGVDATTTGLGIGGCRRLGPGTVVSELLQRRTPGRLDQVGLGGGTGATAA